MRDIAPGLRSFTGLIMGRVYLIEDADGLTLIDAGLGLAAERIIVQLRQAGRRPDEVKRILITHAHPDHVGGLRRLKALTGASVIASALETPVIEGRQPIARRPGKLRLPDTIFKPTPVDRVVADGDVIDALGGLRVVLTPGHAPGHIAFWQPERKILFCGDVLFNRPSLRLPFALLTVDMAENIRSIKKIAGLDAERVCFGHGPPLVQNAARRLRDFSAQIGSPRP
jgi:glyoxylase-like metal-dependent hydrolase (beta-lactamase superfamily II)